MKKKEKLYLKDLSYEQRIEILKNEIELFNELIPLRNYFHFISTYRYTHIVEVRKCVAEDLIKKGLSYKEIGRVFNQDHTTIMHLFTVENHKNVQEEVKENYKQWIEDKIYPVTYCIMVPGHLNATGTRSVIRYKLASTKEEIRKIRTTNQKT